MIKAFSDLEIFLVIAIFRNNSDRTLARNISRFFSAIQLENLLGLVSMNLETFLCFPLCGVFVVEM